MMKRILIILFVLIGYFANSQVLYDPTKFTVSNKSYGSAQATPTEAKSQFRDTTLPSPYMRNYANRAEVLSYLYLAKYRAGKFPIYMDSATHTYVLWFRDGTANANLVYWNTEASSTDSSIFETVYRTDTAKLNLRISIAGKLSNTLNTGQILVGNLSNIATAVTPGNDVSVTSGGSFSVLNQWKLAGNAGTADISNFIGTTDNVPLTFKVNGQKAGRIDNGNANVFLGYKAGNVTSGINNTSVGHNALISNTTGFANVAIGSQSLFNNTTGNQNISLGYNSLYYNVSGINNMAIGQQALDSNMTGNNNTAIGNNTLINNTTGSNNVAIGSNTAKGITTGSYNTIVGSGVVGLSPTLNNNIIIADGLGTQRITVDSLGNMVLNSITAVKAPSGTTAQRPTGVAGYIRYNADSSKVEYFNGAAWVSFGTGSGGGAGTVTSVGATTGTAGTDFAVTGSPITGSGSLTFNLPLASGTNTGKLSSTDWTIFNNKQPAGSYITAITGDVQATGPGSVAATIQPLAVTTGKINTNAVTYGKIQQATQQSLLGATGAANYGEITLGTNLSMTGSVLNATGGGSGGPDSTYIKLGYLSVVDSGARGDGVIVQDASITSGAAILTTSTTNFTSGDVGKSVMVAGAGASGADLYTTILTFNSVHNITLNANAGTTVSNKELDYGTENSVPFQKCLNASLTSYAGLNKIVFVPLGAKPYFFFNPPVSSSLDGSNPYSQIYVPLAKYTPSDSLSSVTLMGQTPPNTYTDYTAGQNTPKSGVILQSVRRDSTASLFGSAYQTVAWGDFNFVKFFLKNVTIRTRSMTNGVDVKPLMNAVNASQIAMLNIDNFRFDIQSAQATSIRPDTATCGLKTPLNNNFADIHITNGLIQGYHTGIVVNEHVNIDNVIIATCYNALDFLASFHSSNFGSILTIWNVNNLRILGATPIIMARWDIENYPSSASLKWFNHQYDIYEPTAVGALGRIAYTRIESGTGVSPLLDLSANVDLKLLTTLIGDPLPTRRVGGLTTFYASTGGDTYSIVANESTKSGGNGQPIFVTKRLGAYLHGFGSDLGGTGGTNSYWYNYTRGMAEAFADGTGAFALGNNAQTAPYFAVDVNGGAGLGSNALTTPNFKFAASANTTTTPTFSFGSFALQSYNSQNSIYGHNLFFNGSAYQYIANGAGNFIQAYNTAGGGIAFGSAPTGTAGGSASVTNNLFISNAGNTYIGGNSDNGYRLEVNGTSKFGTAPTITNAVYAYGPDPITGQLIKQLFPTSSSDTLKVVNVGSGLRVGYILTPDTLALKTLLANNGLTGTTNSDSTNRIVLGGELTQNTNVTGATSTYGLSLGTSGNKLSSLNFASASTIFFNGRMQLNQLGATDADISVPSNYTFITLPAITANRVITLSVGGSGAYLVILNENTSGNTWSFAGTTVKDAAGNTITNLLNGTAYQLIYDGSNFIVIGKN